MPVPPLPEWDSTRTTLHHAAQVIGAVRASVAEPEPNYVHLGLKVIPQGVTTGTLPEVGEFVLDFTLQSIFIMSPDHEPVRIALDEHSQVSLADALVELLHQSGVSLDLPRDKVASEAPFKIDNEVATRYAATLCTLAETLETFRASLPGEKSPAIVWPHGFDLSFLWFATEKALESEPHMAFGFAPASQGFERPYIYTYLYPVPDELIDRSLPPLARWTTEPWTGAVVDYDTLVEQDAPEEMLESHLRQIFDQFSPLLIG